VVGVCSQSGICNGPGKVDVFLKPKRGWKTTSSFKAELTASDGMANDGFSNELGLSADGSTVVVGAAGATVNGNVGQGAAYLFVKPAAGWKTATQTAKLTELHGAAGDFAGEVSVSGDGSTVFVGAPGAAVGANAAQGVAYLFVRPASGWKTTPKFTAKLSVRNGAAYDDFGFCQAGSTCITSDGTTVLVGAPQLNFSTGTPTGPGKAYIFVKPAGGWKTTSKFNAELTASDGQTGDALGWSAAITSNIAVVGAVVGNGGTGAAYVFSKPKAGWKTTSNFTAKLIPSDGDIGDAFAFSVSVSGNTAAVGALNHPSGSTSGPGAAYVFGP
jgi:FG-GAP repeat